MEFQKMLELLGTLILAVILITFLVPQRAWGETSLRNLFTGENENSNDGDPALGHKALDVKINKKTTPPEVYEFHLSDQGVAGNKHVIESDGGEETYFTLRNWNKDKCTLFTSFRLSSSGGEVYLRTKDYVYYINPGAMIEPSCNSLFGCIKDEISSSGCENICTSSKETSQPSEFSICGPLSCRDSSVMTEDLYITPQPFGAGTDYCNEYREGCPSEANGGCCPLVGEEPSKKYTPKYGMICGYEQVSGSTIDSSAKWFACTDNPDSRGRKVFTAGAGGFQFKCDNGKWVVSGDQGIQLSAPQIKQIGLVDEEIEIGFNILNYREKDISNMVIKLTPQDKDGKKPSDCFNDDKNPYRELGAIASLKLPPDKANIDEKDFCLDTRKFTVVVSYTYDSNSETTSYKLNCPDPKENDKWYDCAFA